MASPGYGSPSIKQLFHHGSEDKRSETSHPESFTRGPGAPTRAFGCVPTANRYLTEGADQGRLGISVEPFRYDDAPRQECIESKPHIDLKLYMAPVYLSMSHQFCGLTSDYFGCTWCCNINIGGTGYTTVPCPFVDDERCLHHLNWPLAHLARALLIQVLT